MDASINEILCASILIEQMTSKMLTKIEILVFFYFMRRKITFYTYNHFNSFQIICSVFLPLKHMHSYPASRSFTELSYQKMLDFGTFLYLNI